MARQVESVEDLAEMVRDDPALAREIQSRPAEAIAELAAPLQRDVWIYRIVVGALSLVAVLSIVGAILRGPDVLIPRGPDQVRPHDRLIVFTAADSVGAVRDYFGGA